VTATACLILLADAVVDRAIARIWMPILAVLGLLVAIFSGPFTVASHTAFGGFVVVDTFTTFFRALFCILAIFAVVVAPDYEDGAVEVLARKKNIRVLRCAEAPAAATEQRPIEGGQPAEVPRGQARALPAHRGVTGAR
jgi:AICAR transformylase/IMP cyclohydrolase PurH